MFCAGAGATPVSIDQKRRQKCDNSAWYGDGVNVGQRVDVRREHSWPRFLGREKNNSVSLRP